MGREEDRLRRIMADMAKGQDYGHNLRFDPISKTIRPESKTQNDFDLYGKRKDPDSGLVLTPSDANLYGSAVEKSATIVIPSDLVKEIGKRKRPKKVKFISHDDGDVFSVFSPAGVEGNVSGYLIWNENDSPVDDVANSEIAKIALLISNRINPSDQPSVIGNLRVNGYMRNHNCWKKSPVQVVPVKEELFSRLGGLFETDVLSKKRVFIPGQGSGGSQITLELIKSGIGKIDLMDHDRFEVGNTVRHAASLKDIGRLKTKVMAEMARGKNPEVEIRTWEKMVSWENIDLVRGIVKQADIVICATDNQPSRLILNRLSVEEKTPCIFAGAFRRAYGGQILFVKPNVTPCYQCFLMQLPEQAADQEISGHQQAQALAYTDRPVPIEPGLSTDIAPIGLLVVKLVIQELLKGTETTLRSLDEDLVAPWYLWLNRREQHTQYEALTPLEYNVDGMHILRWYGVSIEKHPGCPVCGNFEAYQVESETTAVKGLLTNIQQNQAGR